MKNKIIFLDIDGVLNLRSKKKWDSGCINNLNQILILTNAKIVVTSTWRCTYNLEELQNIFINQGIEGEVVGITEQLGHRATEILTWVEENDIDEYVVIDDRYAELEDDIPEENFFKLDQHIGLRDNDIKTAIIFKLNPDLIFNIMKG